jgi:hypothetical protein
MKTLELNIVDTPQSIKIDPIKKEAKLHPKAIQTTLANSGFTLESSLSELLDNSIDAESTEIKISYPSKSQKSEAIIEIIDNGNGMSAVDIERIPDIGSEREYSSDDIGYFGIGGTQAILALSERVVVKTKRRGDSFYTILHWDIINDGLEYTISSEETKEINKSGTKITCYPGSKYDKLYRQESTLYRTLGTKYFHLLSNDNVDRSLKKLFKLFINSKLIEPLDPMYRKDSNTSCYGEEIIKLVDSEIYINAYYLGNVIDINLYDARDNAGFNVSKSGVYLLFNGRYLNLGGNWAGVKSLHPETRTTRVEINIPKEAIKEFGIQSNKNEPKFEIDNSHPSQTESKFIEIIGLITSWAHKKDKEKSDNTKKIQSPETKQADKEMTDNLNKILKNKNIKKTPLDNEIISEQIPNKSNEDGEKTTKNRPEIGNYKPQTKKLLSFERKSFGENDSFLRCERENKTTCLKLNTDHTFYKDFYQQFDEKNQIKLNLFLYGLANAEQKSYGDNHFETKELMTLWDRFWRDASDAMSDYLS